MRRSRVLVGAAFVLAGALWFASAPERADDVTLPAHAPDLRNGEALFREGACLACHAPPADSGRAPSLPTGGAPFKTPIGVFYPQNLTPDADTGLGRWSDRDFVAAMTRGVSPAGAHYFPAFPYPSYRSMTTPDLLDLRAWLARLPAVRAPYRRPGVRFELIARRAVGLWKRLAFRRPLYVPDPARLASWRRGAYLANAVGHCGECHTPKNWLKIADDRRRMQGGPHPAGEGDVPSLRGLVRRKKYKDADDLALALRNGETLGYEDLSSGGMAAIQESLARAPEPDVRAIAEYLVSLDDRFTLR